MNTEETAKLWAAAHKLSIQELKSETSKSWNFLDKTNYGLWGNKNMVSEASRWALVSIGREIPETSRL
ncbi:MAG: hypothetical protein IPO53_10640 [Chitinophagaceae bacterium]|nr:hypothetical protein [Chitinophagaceae bacterium]